VDSIDHIERRIRGWTKAVAIVGLLGLLVVSITTMLDVFLRWIANAPFRGLNDINGLAVAIVIAACLPLVVAERQNITIRFLGDAVGPRVSRWLDAFGSAALLAYVALIGWQLVVYTADLAESGRTTWFLMLPVTPSWVVATILVLLCVPIQAVAFAVDVVRAVTGIPSEHDRHGVSGSSAL
jgi:TRAP-type C4-dicarboxylate transport system permease small subunit